MDRRIVQYGTLNQSVPTVVPASQLTPGVPVSKACTIYHPVFLRVDVLVTHAVVASGVSLVLQQSPGPDHTGNNAEWTTLATKTVSGTSTDTYYTFLVMAEDPAFIGLIPLAEQVRVVAITGAGDSLTVARVTVLS